MATDRVATNFEAIQFNKQFHTYTLHGRRLAGVTSLISRLKGPFDAAYWSKKKAAERGVSPAVILAEWDEAKKIGLEKGTRLHDHIERRLRGEDGKIGDPFLALNGRIPEMDAFDRLWAGLAGTVKPHRVEWIIGDEMMGIAGTTDAVFFSEQTGLFHIWDWKTGKKFNTENRFQQLLDPFTDLAECELVTYSLQTSIYRVILERNTSLELGDSYLVYFAPDGQYTVHRAMDLRARVLEWLNGGSDESANEPR